MKASIINKKVIYEPLLFDYKSLLGQLNAGKVVHFAYDAEFRTYGSTLFDAWRRIKSDSRYYQMPDFLRKECVHVEGLIDKYESCKARIIDASYTEIAHLLKEHNYEIKENANGIRTFVDIESILTGQNFAEHILTEKKIAGVPVVDEDVKPILCREYSERITATKVVQEYIDAKTKLTDYLIIVIKSIETIIIRISDVYEKRNSIL